jgi:hypothetical protein
MNAVEWVLSAMLVAGGVRSLWIWSRRRFEGDDLVDHLLYAMFTTGRVGLWFALAGLFAMYASTDVEGRAFIEDVERFRWYVLVPIVLSAMQFLAGQLLGRRTPEARGRPTTHAGSDGDGRG